MVLIVHLSSLEKVRPSWIMENALDFFNEELLPWDLNIIRMGADLLLVIQDHVGDRSAVSIFNGLYFKRTAMVISQDFIFTRYIIAHEFGHILGCGHEEGADPALNPPMFFAHSHMMENGQCDLMSNPVNRKCKQGPFFSNPDIKIDSIPTGNPYKANNALWITNNRYALSKVGNERFNRFPCGSNGPYRVNNLTQIWNFWYDK